MSRLEDVLEFHLSATGLKPEREYQFHPERKWRFDFCFPDKKLAIECEGGVWIAGRHNRPQGMINDIEKYNAAALMGYTVLRYTMDMIRSGEALQQIEEALGEAK